PSTCPTAFDGDVALVDWNEQTLDSTGSVKTLMLTLVLDALLGADVMAQAYSTFVNELPDSGKFLRLLQGLAPDKADELEELFSVWVYGTGDADENLESIRERFADADGDGLYLFEEEKLGLSDAAADDYLN